MVLFDISLTLITLYTYIQDWFSFKSLGITDVIKRIYIKNLKYGKKSFTQDVHKPN